MKAYLQLVKDWFLENKRSFPWRENCTPYRVWVSEIMLQQTIASVVVPYFEKWMERFPNVQVLAQAEIDDVIKLWEGLGYYSRARNLHKGAQYVLNHFNGVLPEDEDSLEKIPGLGPYTRGAILSFAFHKKACAIDANVLRVFARFYGIQEEIDTLSCQKKIRALCEQVLPENESWIISEAFIELGATVCKKKAECLKCPLKKGCRSYRDGLQSVIPKKRVKPQTTSLFRIVAIIECDGEFLVKKGEKGKVMGDLYEFPYIEKMAPPTIEEAISDLKKAFGDVHFAKQCMTEKHSFTRFRATLYPFHMQTYKKSDGVWVKKEELQKLPFSSGHRRILYAL